MVVANFAVAVAAAVAEVAAAAAVSVGKATTVVAVAVVVVAVAAVAPPRLAAAAWVASVLNIEALLLPLFKSNSVDIGLVGGFVEGGRERCGCFWRAS